MKASSKELIDTIDYFNISKGKLIDNSEKQIILSMNEDFNIQERIINL